MIKNYPMSIFDNKKLKIAVFGDSMLDRYIKGSCERISPESPVPVVVPNEVFDTLGGAGNVVANIKGLNFEALPVGFVGKDYNAGKLLDLYNKIGCNTSYIRGVKNFVTITKTRVVANGQQVLRIDDEKLGFSGSFSKNYINSIVKYSDIIIISDYGKGALDGLSIKEIIKSAKLSKKMVLVDPKKAVANFDSYKNCDVITPNFYETKSLFPDISNTDKDIVNSAKRIQNNYSIRNIVITRGSQGITILSKDNKINHLPAQAKEVFDVSGAGDTVIATLGVCLGLNMNLVDAGKIANLAAGLVVTHHGTTPISLNELKKEMNIKL